MAIGWHGIPTYFTLTQPQYDACAEIISAAQAAWIGMVTQFAAENLAMGITQAGKTGLIADALQQVMVYGSSGSLWQAFAALSEVVVTPEMAPYLTQDRIEWMKNVMIQAISNLP